MLLLTINYTNFNVLLFFHLLTTLLFYSRLSSFISIPLRNVRLYRSIVWEPESSSEFSSIVVSIKSSSNIAAPIEPSSNIVLADDDDDDIKILSED